MEKYLRKMFETNSHPYSTMCYLPLMQSFQKPVSTVTLVCHHTLHMGLFDSWLFGWMDELVRVFRKLSISISCSRKNNVFDSVWFCLPFDGFALDGWIDEEFRTKIQMYSLFTINNNLLK